MQIDKSQILDLLRSQGQHEQASQAEGELPDQVDPERDSGLLSKFGIDPKELMGGAGGIAGKFGL